MRQALAALLAVLAVAGSANAARDPNDAAIGDRIVAAVPAGGRLWLLGAGGRLASFDLDQGKLAADPAVDVFGLASDGADLVLARQRGHDLLVTVRRGAGEKALAPLRLGAKQGVAAMVAGPDGPVVLTNEGTFEWQGAGARWRRVAYRAGGMMAPPHVTAALVPGARRLVVGYDEGEWGGRLDEVNLDTGESTVVGGSTPVTAVVADPTHPGCAIAAQGLSHMGMTEGALLRVCNGKGTEIYANATVDARGFKHAEPFFGLTAAKGAVWAVSYRHLVRLGENDKAEVTDLPQLSRIDGVWLSRDLPGLVVIRTDVTWANSVSGYTPLVVPAP